jgi:para-nitrobenzyl esterase
MPSSRGLFARAIMESGACDGPIYTTQAESDARVEDVEHALGCDDLACLRAKPADAILVALPLRRGNLLEPGVWWGPIVGGADLPRTPLDAIRAGDFAHVPLVIGWNRDEGVLHTISFDEDEIRRYDVISFVRGVWGDAAIFPVQLLHARASEKQTLTDLVTDGVFACDARRVARAFAAQRVPVFEYEFTHPLDDARAHALGATHSVELWFVFGVAGGGIALSARERTLSDQMMDAWGRFARTGDPGWSWPRFDRATDVLFEIDLEPHAREHVDQGVCDFWDDVSSTSSAASAIR